MGKLAFEGVRVVEVTNSWAGPYTAGLLASLGAEVIKVESMQYLDPWRVSTTANGPQDKFWERSALWNSVNCDKLGITLDLNRAEGLDVFRRLLRQSDIFVENFTPRVMRNFGLDYPAVKEVTPSVIMISLPAYGATGPWSEFPGFAGPIEQMSGVPQLTGYPDSAPRNANWGGFTDPTAGVNGFMAVVFALLYRKRTGKGQYIDLSQVEAVTCMLGDAIIDWTMNGRVQPRRGNQHTWMAPHGYYRCSGDEWIGIAVSSDAEWQRLADVIREPWSGEERFKDSLSRWKNQEELNKLIEQWTVKRNNYEVMNMLQTAGVAAGAVLTNGDFLSDPHLQSRHTYQEVDRQVVGRHAYPLPSAPMRLSSSPTCIRRPAPLFGEHNEYVLGKLLGISQEEIRALADERIIGNVPSGF